MEKRFGVDLKNPGVADVAVRRDGKIMASGGWDGRYVIYFTYSPAPYAVSLTLYRIRVFGWKKGNPLAILNYHSAVVHCVAFAGHQAPSEDSNLLICGSKDSRISLWKLY